MTKWVVLGGAVLVSIALATLTTLYPTAMQGFSGLVIWIFLGYCSLIVIAQVFAAVREVAALVRRLAAARSPSALARVREGGKQ
ncbi:hypothetical protein JCM30471_35410 [Desulfuromonas carbonis]